MASQGGTDTAALAGPIRVSDNGWYFVDAAGAPFFWLGSECTLNAARRAADGSCALVFLSSQCHVLLHLDRIATRQVRITWANPRDGEERDGGIHATGNRAGGVFPRAERQWLSVPGHWEDAVLVLDGVG